MLSTIKKWLGVKEMFYDSKDFSKRLDAKLKEFDHVPTGRTMDAVFNTNDDAAVWMKKNQRSITEEEYFSILQKHLNLLLEKHPEPPHFEP